MDVVVVPVDAINGLYITAGETDYGNKKKKDGQMMKRFVTALEHLNSQVMSSSSSSSSFQVPSSSMIEATDNVLYALFDIGLEKLEIPKMMKHRIVRLISKCVSQIHFCVNWHIDRAWGDMDSAAVSTPVVVVASSEFENICKIRSAVDFLFYQYGDCLIEGEPKEFVALLDRFHDELKVDLQSFDARLYDECPASADSNVFKCNIEILRKIPDNHWWWPDD